MRPRVVLALLALLTLAYRPFASAQDLIASDGRWIRPGDEAALTQAVNPKSAAPAPAFGTASTSRLLLGPCDASVRVPSQQPYVTINCDIMTPVLSDTAPNASAGFPIHLPTGSLITSVTVNYFDNAVADLGMSIQQTDSDGIQSLAIATPIGAGNGGKASKTFVVDPPYEVDGTKTLTLLVVLNSTDATHYTGFINAGIDYRLQVSPPPALATFTDVPTNNQFFQYVEALVAAGITNGIGGGLYGVNQPVTRGQLAKFLATALGLHFPN